jgi:hypothetical protein
MSYFSSTLQATSDSTIEGWEEDVRDPKFQPTPFSAKHHSDEAVVASKRQPEKTESKKYKNNKNNTSLSSFKDLAEVASACNSWSQDNAATTAAAENRIKAA